jgi:hypothetical protein
MAKMADIGGEGDMFVDGTDESQRGQVTEINQNDEDMVHEEIRSTFEEILSRAQDESPDSTPARLQCLKSGNRKGLKRSKIDSGSDDDDDHVFVDANDANESNHKPLNWYEALSNDRSSPPRPKSVLFRSPDVMLNKVSPVCIAKALNELGNNHVDRVIPVRDGGIVVKCFTASQAAKLQKVNRLGKWMVEASFPVGETQCKGVISGVPLDVSMEDLIGLCKNSGVVSARRLNRRVDGKFQESLSVCLTFKVSKLPSAVNICYQHYPVRQFIPPVVRCFKCQRFGHYASSCRAGKSRCVRCGEDHKYDECKTRDEPKCCRCGGAHSAAYGGCITMIREKEIQYMKTTNKLSYAEAAKRYDNEQTNDTGLSIVHNSQIQNTGNRSGINDTGLNIVQNSQIQNTGNKSGTNVDNGPMPRGRVGSVLPSVVRMSHGELFSGSSLGSYSSIRRSAIQVEKCDVATQTETVSEGTQTMDMESDVGLKVGSQLVKLLVGAVTVGEVVKEVGDRELAMEDLLKKIFGSGVVGEVLGQSSKVKSPGRSHSGDKKGSSVGSNRHSPPSPKYSFRKEMAIDKEIQNNK